MKGVLFCSEYVFGYVYVLFYVYHNFSRWWLYRSVEHFYFCCSKNHGKRLGISVLLTLSQLQRKWIISETQPRSVFALFPQHPYICSLPLIKNIHIANQASKLCIGFLFCSCILLPLKCTLLPIELSYRFKSLCLSEFLT